MLPTHVFLIDVSHVAVTSGATAAACSAVSGNLEDLQGVLWHMFCPDIDGILSLLLYDGLAKQHPFSTGGVQRSLV